MLIKYIINIKMFFCNICNKNYSSYKSLWTHNKKFHKNNDNIQIVDNKTNQIVDNDIEQITNKLLETNCEFCSKILKNKYLLKKNLVRCKFALNNINIKNKIDGNITDNVGIKYLKINIDQNELNNDEQNKINLERDKIKLEQDKIKLAILNAENKKMDSIKETLKLKIKLLKLSPNNKDNKISKKSGIDNINDKLTTYSNHINSHNNVNSNNSIKLNNNTVNNFQIIALGKENVLDCLTLAEKKEIIKSRYSCLEKAIDIVHCGPYDKFKNIIITNVKDTFAFKYDDKINKFICVDKNEIMNELIDERLGDIKDIYDELNDINKIDTKTKKLIQDFLHKMNNEEKYTEIETGTIYKNFRAYKEHKIKILIYNNFDKISKDLTIILNEPFNKSKDEIQLLLNELNTDLILEQNEFLDDADKDSNFILDV